MKSDCFLVNLHDALLEAGQEKVITGLISSFSCPLNKSIEYFLYHNAINFSKQRIAITYLVMVKTGRYYSLAGYFTLANKILYLNKDVIQSRKLEKRIAKFSQYDNDSQTYSLPILFIGQIGKNYTDGYDKFITGNELLNYALQEINKAQKIIGGKIVYLECESKQKLIDFYIKNDFRKIGFSKKQLVRMIKYM